MKTVTIREIRQAEAIAKKMKKVSMAGFVSMCIMIPAFLYAFAGTVENASMALGIFVILFISLTIVMFGSGERKIANARVRYLKSHNR